MVCFIDFLEFFLGILKPMRVMQKLIRVPFLNQTSVSFFQLLGSGFRIDS